MTARRIISIAVLCELDNGKVHQLALNKYEEEEVRTMLICYIYNKYQKIKCHEEELPIILKEQGCVMPAWLASL